jgi:branched-chain amino acid transport system ATP-binding protein
MILRVEHVSRSFQGLAALTDVSFAVPQGQIFALIGPNGAGKTTLFSVISGFLVPDTGKTFFEDRDVTSMQPHRIAALGLVRTFQITRPFARQSVRENIAVGAHLRLRRRRDALDRAAKIAGVVGLGDRLDQSAGTLTIAGRKRLELARALATSPRLLLLDEVMAGLNPTEVEAIVPVIKTIRDGGVTIVLVEHVMQAVMSLADRGIVLNDGRMVVEGSPRELVSDPRVIEAYLGAGAGKRFQAVAGHA